MSVLFQLGIREASFAVGEDFMGARFAHLVVATPAWKKEIDVSRVAVWLAAVINKVCPKIETALVGVQTIEAGVFLFFYKNDDAHFDVLAIGKELDQAIQILKEAVRRANRN